MNLILIGMRGTGKSNVARRLSVLSKRPVLSTDVLISYDNAGKSVADIIGADDGGWATFRNLEYQVLTKIAQLDEVIVDCGGGAVVDLDSQGNEVFSERKVALLRACGLVIWLKGDIARLAAKTRLSSARPTLDVSRSAEEVMRRRLPFYERAAHVTIDVEGMSREDLARQVFNLTGTDPATPTG